jgi:hypothetical protein
LADVADTLTEFGEQGLAAQLLHVLVEKDAFDVPSACSCSAPGSEYRPLI